MQRHVVLILLYIMMCLSSSSNNAAFAFLWDKEVAVVNSPWALFPVAVRHVEYVGVRDNGTLDCFTPGFSQYEWRLFDKSASDLYAESFELVTRLKILKHHSRVNIGDANFDMNGDMLVVMCSPLLDHRPKLRVIWVITRLHSPMGYPTDPRVCDFGAKSAASGCHWYKHHHNTECYYGTGMDYLGHEKFVDEKRGECLYWHDARMSRLNPSKVFRLPYYHNFCRRVKGDKLFKPWCYTKDGKLPKKTPCKIPQCSDCIYGEGNGKFSLYPKRRFPIYQGRDLFVVEKNKKGEQLRCVVGQLCKPRSKGMPSCQVKTWSGKKNMDCFLKQCTVRLVWFLFFDLFGRSYVEQSNVDPVEIILVEGKKNQRIHFGAFGIHLTSGLTVGTKDGNLAKYVKNIHIVKKAPPNSLSQLVFKSATKELAGVYFVQYQFEEANSKIQGGTHRAKFKITVKSPMRFVLKPAHLKVCHGQSGTLRLHISGFFDLLEGSIRWKYGTSSRKMANIPLDDNNFRLSNDFLSLTVKTVTKDLVISAGGRAFSGKASTKAHIEIKAQPRVKAASSTTIYSSSEDDVHLVVASEKNIVLKWMFEATEIPEIPDDPKLAFQREIQNKTVLQTLVITELEFRHYGLYSVEGEKDGCKESIQFFVKHASERPGDEKPSKRPGDEKPSSISAINCSKPLSLENEENARMLCPKSRFTAQLILTSCSKASAVGHNALSNGSVSLVQYQSNTVEWMNYTSSMHTEMIQKGGINYSVHWLNEPFVARSFRFFLQEAKCLQDVKIYGCKADLKACSVTRHVSTDFPISMTTALLMGVGVLAVAMGIVFAVRSFKKTPKDSKSDSSLKECQGEERRKDSQCNIDSSEDSSEESNKDSNRDSNRDSSKDSSEESSKDSNRDSSSDDSPDSSENSIPKNSQVVEKCKDGSDNSSDREDSSSDSRSADSQDRSGYSSDADSQDSSSDSRSADSHDRSGDSDNAVSQDSSGNSSDTDSQNRRATVFDYVRK